MHTTDSLPHSEKHIFVKTHQFGDDETITLPSGGNNSRDITLAENEIREDAIPRRFRVNRQFRKSGFWALSLLILFLCGISATTNASETVSEMSPPQSIRLEWIGKRNGPTVVKSEDEFSRAISNIHDEDKLRDQIDFSTHNLVIFAWKGHAQDRLKFEATDKKVEFVHWGNAPGDDPHLHCRIFGVKKGTEVSVRIDPDPR